MSEIHYEMREQDLIAFEEHMLAGIESVQKALRRHQAHIPAFVAVVALVLFFYMKDIPASIYALLLAMAWGLGAPVFLKHKMRKQILQMYTDAEKANLRGRYTLRAEPGGLVEVDAQGQTNKLPWKQVLRVEVEKKYVFIFIGIKSALIVPRDTVSKDSNLHEFVKTVDERIEKEG